jgi:restriction system protein
MPVARSGGRSEWERGLAAQRREAEQQAREQARLAKEREKLRQQQHLESQQHAAEQKTAAVERQVKIIDEVLTSVLPLPAWSFERLMVSPRVTPFDPGPIGVPTSEPNWEDFAPQQPKGVSRILGGTSRFNRQMEEARARFEAAQSEYRAKEAQRRQAFADARTRHDRKIEEERVSIAKQNAYISSRQSAFATGDSEAVEWFVGRVLDASPYPKDFPREYQLAYRPQNRDVVIEFELPSNSIVPRERAYSYVKSSDVIKPSLRPQNETKQRYKKLISCVALRTLHEIFSATSPDVVEAVVFNGRLRTVDRATGKPARPHLVTVSAERAAFTDLVLAAVEPAACLVRLNALVSPNPYDMEAVEPFIAFDLKRFRFTDDIDVISDLDSRPNLLKLSPTEFEHLVRQLFIAMGAEAWTTIPSKDGGVDAVATSKNLFFGGVCLIQAKRWTGLVGLESVHALTGVMADHNATTGVLVTTSWFGRASEQFAKRNRITLINGAELKQLIREHLKKEVIPGTSPPRRLQASDNLQTGRPGPEKDSPEE